MPGGVWKADGAVPRRVPSSSRGPQVGGGPSHAVPRAVDAAGRPPSRVAAGGCGGGPFCLRGFAPGKSDSRLVPGPALSSPASARPQGDLGLQFMAQGLEAGPTGGQGDFTCSWERAQTCRRSGPCLAQPLRAQGGPSSWYRTSPSCQAGGSDPTEVTWTPVVQGDTRTGVPSAGGDGVPACVLARSPSVRGTKMMGRQPMWCQSSFHVCCQGHSERRKGKLNFFIPRQGVFVREKAGEAKCRSVPKTTSQRPWRVAATGLRGPFLVACPGAHTVALVCVEVKAKFCRTSWSLACSPN